MDDVVLLATRDASDLTTEESVCLDQRLPQRGRPLTPGLDDNTLDVIAIELLRRTAPLAVENIVWELLTEGEEKPLLVKKLKL